MELSDLQIFKAVVEQGGIVRAARKLHRVPSNVTQRVKQLEASLSVELFSRDGRQLHLTPGGHTLLSYADRLLQLAEEAKGAVSATPLRGTLRLGSMESTAATRLPGILARFHVEYPNVRVELTTGTNDALTAALADRSIDAAFVAEPPKSARFASVPAFDERLVLITALGHASLTRPRQLQGQSVIAFPRGCAYRRMLERWLGDRQLATVRVMELSSYHAIVACVAAGSGFAAVPESLLATLASEQVGAHAVPSLSRAIVTSLVWRVSDAMPAVAGLRKLLAGDDLVEVKD